MMSHVESEVVAAGLIRPAPADDELLTSYLARTACLHGIDANHYCAHFLPGIAVWSRDFDRSASDTALTKVARLLGLDIARLQAMTLRDYEASGMRFGVNPWINAVGVRLRNTRSFGLQYCPQCLLEEQAFKRIWRLACIVACDQHECLLRDSCPACDAPVTLHLAQVSILRCHACGAWLTAPEQIKELQPLPIPLEIQQLLATAITGQHVLVFGQPDSGQELMRCLAGLIRLVRERIRSFPKTTGEAAVLPPSRIEFMRVTDRAKVLNMLERALLHGPTGLELFCSSLGLLQRHFRSLGALPTWLATCVEKLPSGSISARRRTTLSSVEQLAKIRLRKRPGWREEHAKTLLEAMVDRHGN